MWDESVKSVGEWHEEQRFDFITKALPLPQDEKVKFLFGAEAEMDYNFTLGVSDEHIDCFDFITVSTTHLHLEGYTVKKRPQIAEEAAELWLKRFEELLKKDLPWHKMGVSHLTGTHVFKANHAKAISLLKTNDLYDIFSNAGIFATIMYCQIDILSDEITIFNCGHPAPFHLHSSKFSLEQKESGGTMLGVTEEVDYYQHVLRLDVGDFMFIITDGITEAMNENNVFFILIVLLMNPVIPITQHCHSERSEESLT